MLVINIINYLILRFIFQWGIWWYNAIFAFNVGTMVATYEYPVIKFYQQHTKLLLLAIPFMLFAVYAAPHFVNDETTSFLYSVVFPMVIYILVTMLGLFGSRYLQTLGHYSFEIYLTQSVYLLLVYVVPNLWLFVLLLVLCSVLASISLKRLSNIVSINYSITQLNS